MIFKIDLTRIKEIKRRQIIFELKITIPALIIIVIITYLTSTKGDLKTFIYISLILIPALFLRALFSTRNLKQTAEAFEISLTDNGIEQIFKLKIVKEINWGDMNYEIKSNGFIYVLDKSLPASNKRTIQIPPEIQNKEQLINELEKHCG